MNLEFPQEKCSFLIEEGSIRFAMGLFSEVKSTRYFHILKLNIIQRQKKNQSVLIPIFWRDSDMAYIFLDESGDLGFNFEKTGTSKVFIIACLFTANKRSIEKLVRAVHRGLRKKYRRVSSELHAYKEEPITRQRLLAGLATRDCEVMVIYLNKTRVYTRLQDEKAVLYNYVANILLDRIIRRGLVQKNEQIHLIASRRETNKFLNQNFQAYLHRQVTANHELDIVVEIKTPAEERVLQAVDFVSWSVFRKYQSNDDSYYNLVRNKIVEERPLFP